MMRDRSCSRGVSHVGLVLCLTAIVTIANSGCRGRRLGDALDSPEAVARAVLQGLAARNVDRLRTLAITEEEFRDLVWPKLPTSRPERHVPWDYAWQDPHSKSRMQMQARLNEWRDQSFELVSVEFEGEDGLRDIPDLSEECHHRSRSQRARNSRPPVRLCDRTGRTLQSLLVYRRLTTAGAHGLQHGRAACRAARLASRASSGTSAKQVDKQSSSFAWNGVRGSASA
jgi:hypothetical protein